jgi:hypothetical protein
MFDEYRFPKDAFQGCKKLRVTKDLTLNFEFFSK